MNECWKEEKMEKFGMVIKDRHAIAIKRRSEVISWEPVFCFVTVSIVLVLVHTYLLIRLTEMVPAVYRETYKFNLHQSKQLNFPPPLQPFIPKHDTSQKDPCCYPFEYIDFLDHNKHQNKSHE